MSTMKGGGGNYDVFLAYTSLTDDPGGIRRHTTMMKSDICKHEIALNPDIDSDYLFDAIQKYTTAPSYDIAEENAKNQYLHERKHGPSD